MAVPFKPSCWALHRRPRPRAAHVTAGVPYVHRYACIFIDAGGSAHDARVIGEAGAYSGLEVLDHRTLSVRLSCTKK